MAQKQPLKYKFDLGEVAQTKEFRRELTEEIDKEIIKILKEYENSNNISNRKTD